MISDYVAPPNSTPDTIDFHWRYLHTLRMCQKHGHRLGVVYDAGWSTIGYILDGVQYRFRHGIIMAYTAE